MEGHKEIIILQQMVFYVGWYWPWLNCIAWSGYQKAGEGTGECDTAARNFRIIVQFFYVATNK